VNKGFTKRIVELTKDESDVILEYLFKVCPSCFFSFFLSSLPDYNFFYSCTDVNEILVGLSKSRQPSSIQVAQE
jgi:hypothetical protein